uniref:Uncharacterized protein n=1 Tax=uncultured microorganism TaxID=358574 RepID=L8B1M6_9ZZZZ|nr:hypothetical protein [uncultured microorganism]
MEFVMKVEFIVNNDREISDALKKSSALAKENKFDDAIELLKETLPKMFSAGTSYPGDTYAKIIPYFQKAGHYLEIEAFSIKYLIPEVELKAKKNFSHKSIEIQNAFGSLYVSDIYKKMALCAKREKLKSDESRFNDLTQEYKTKYSELLELGEQTSLQLDYKKAVKKFGSDTHKWSDTVKRKYQSILLAEKGIS